VNQRKVLEDSAACGLAVYHAFQQFFGEQVDTWEPESVRLEAKSRDLVIPQENYDAYHALRAVRLHPAFFWDANVFENTVMCLNKLPMEPGEIQAPTPPEIAWGVWQVEEFEPTEWDYDYEPVSYAAVICKAYGLVCCPHELCFAEDRLIELTPEHDELRSEVKKRWSELQHPADQPFAEDPVGVQLALLSSVYAYVEQHKKNLHSLLSAS